MSEASIYQYEDFKDWIARNGELTEHLQTWLYYRYAVANGLSGTVDLAVDSADIVVYFALFYVSSHHGNEYHIHTTLGDLSQMLEVHPDVVLKGLNSLENHGLIAFGDDEGKIELTIQPITATPHHHHHHDEHDHE